MRLWTGSRVDEPYEGVAVVNVSVEASRVAGVSSPQLAAPLGASWRRGTFLRERNAAIRAACQETPVPSMKQIAERFGMKENYVRKLLSRMGVRKKPATPPKVVWTEEMRAAQLMRFASYWKDPEYRARRLRVLRAFTDQVRIHWDSDMDAMLIHLYQTRSYTEFRIMAPKKIGVGLTSCDKRIKALGIGRGRPRNLCSRKAKP